jgi:hypothetical protein
MYHLELRIGGYIFILRHASHGLGLVDGNQVYGERTGKIHNYNSLTKNNMSERGRYSTD